MTHLFVSWKATAVQSTIAAVILVFSLFAPAALPAHHDGDVRTQVFKISQRTEALLRQRIADGSVDSYLHGLMPPAQRGPHSVYYDAAQNICVVTDTPANIERMKHYLTGLNEATAPRLEWRSYSLKESDASMLASLLPAVEIPVSEATAMTPGREVVLDGDTLRVRESDAELFRLENLLVERGIIESRRPPWSQVALEMMLIDPTRLTPEEVQTLDQADSAVGLSEDFVFRIARASVSSPAISGYEGGSMSFDVVHGKYGEEPDYTRLQFAMRPAVDRETRQIILKDFGVWEESAESFSQSHDGVVFLHDKAWTVHPETTVFALESKPHEYRLLLRATLVDL